MRIQRKRWQTKYDSAKWNWMWKHWHKNYVPTYWVIIVRKLTSQVVCWFKAFVCLESAFRMGEILCTNQTKLSTKISKSSLLFCLLLCPFEMAIMRILNGVRFQLCWSYDKTFSYIKVIAVKSSTRATKNAKCKEMKSEREKDKERKKHRRKSSTEWQKPLKTQEAP